jgi:hypothetical protein
VSSPFRERVATVERLGPILDAVCGELSFVSRMSQRRAENRNPTYSSRAKGEHERPEAGIRPNPYFQPPDAKLGFAVDVSDVRFIAFAPQDPTSGRLAISKFVVVK